MPHIAPNGKVVVQFDADAPTVGHARGEIAGFGPDHAQKLVQSGWAHYWYPPAVEGEAIPAADDDASTRQGRGRRS